MYLMGKKTLPSQVSYDLRHRAYIAQRWRFGLYGMFRRLKKQLGTM